jgi:hypothetical protein
MRTQEGKALKLKAANVPKWAQQSQENTGLGGEMGDGAGKRVMKCEVCTEIEKEGSS